MLYYDRIDLSEGIDVAKSSNSKKCIICYYWYFNQWLKFQNSVCNSSHDLARLCRNLGDIAIITVESVVYCCIIHEISKYEAILLLENYVLDDCGYIQNACQIN